MAEKVCGYGRYRDDPEYVGCPRAQTDMTPCIARDGALALAQAMGGQGLSCVGCDARPRRLLIELSSESGQNVGTGGTETEVADRLRELVREVTEPDNVETPE